MYKTKLVPKYPTALLYMPHKTKMAGQPSQKDRRIFLNHYWTAVLTKSQPYPLMQ